MNISNSILDYKPHESKEIAEKIASVIKKMMRTDLLLTKEIKTATRPKKNVIYLDLKVVTEFEKLKEVSIPLHEAVEKCSKWVEQLWKMASHNRGYYKNKKLFSVLAQVHQIVTLSIMLLPLEGLSNN